MFLRSSVTVAPAFTPSPIRQEVVELHYAARRVYETLGIEKKEIKPCVESVWRPDAPGSKTKREEGSMITVLLVDDEAIVREGLRMRLAREPDITIVGEAITGAETLEQVQRLQPDVVLMDPALSDMDGVVTITMLRAAYADSAVVILSLQDDAVIRARVQAAGAAAFVSKYEGAKAILPAIRHLDQRGS
jgi:CheY-like chemotaxis protein